MRVVRVYRPDVERQIKALLLLLRAPVPAPLGNAAEGEGGAAPQGEGQDAAQGARPKRKAGRNRSAAA